MTTIVAGRAGSDSARVIDREFIERARSRPTAAARFAATNAVAREFFGEHADGIARACHAMAGRFQGGGRLFVCGDSGRQSDVSHVVVEFVHPVVVGKRALPAIALPPITGEAARQALATLGRSGDIVMVLTAGAMNESARTVVSEARANGLLGLAFSGPVDELPSIADHLFAVPSADPFIVQETHEMLYHVLWELVHVFFEHRAVV